MTGPLLRQDRTWQANEWEVHCLDCAGTGPMSISMTAAFTHQKCHKWQRWSAVRLRCEVAEQFSRNSPFKEDFWIIFNTLMNRQGLCHFQKLWNDCALLLAFIHMHWASESILLLLFSGQVNLWPSGKRAARQMEEHHFFNHFDDICGHRIRLLAAMRSDSAALFTSWKGKRLQMQRNHIWCERLTSYTWGHFDATFSWS